MQHDMKSINLFGQEEHVFTNRRKSQKSIFDDYEGFVEKFNPKKTTDDCYTPPAVYDYVLQYVADHCDIDGMTVVRPFYPGDRKSTRLNSSHMPKSRMPSSA